MAFWKKNWGSWSWQRSLLLKTAILGLGIAGVLWVGWPQPQFRYPDEAPLPSGLHQSTLKRTTPSSTTQFADTSTEGRKNKNNSLQTVDVPVLIDLNLSSQSELQSLPGIGIKLAERIVTYRSSHGAFREVNELARVSGIGEKRLRRLEPFVTVKSVNVTSHS